MKMNCIKLTFLFSLVFCIGCGPVNSAYSGIKGFFFPKKVDMQKQADISREEKKLAKLFSGSEQELHYLIRELKTFEKKDSPRSAEFFYNQFEYVNWVAITDLEGNIDRINPVDFKDRVEMKKLLKNVQNNFPQNLHLGLPDKESKTDICIFKPLYKGYSLDGYIIVDVDFKSLMNYNSRPGKLVVLTPNKILWAGEYRELAQEMINRDWEKKLADTVKGKMLIDNRRFFWFARYIGVDPIVYILKHP